MKLAFLLLVAATTSHAASYALVISGLGGNPDYETQFASEATEMGKALKANPSVHVETLSGAHATRQEVHATLARLNTEIRPEDTFTLLLIGHGSFDGEQYKFNLPGPDITGSELASSLDRIPARRQLIVNMTSASGASVGALARKNRVVITSTKSGNEKNLTVFPRYWLDALRDPAADTDKNGTISALEAFHYAQRKTANYFESEKLLATEHSILDDDGGKEGVRDPSPSNGQGLIASSFPLIQSASETTRAATAGKQKLLAKKDELESEIDKVKYQKAAMTPEDYKKQLSALLLELARTQAEIDR